MLEKADSMTMKVLNLMSKQRLWKQFHFQAIQISWHFPFNVGSGLGNLSRF